MIGLLLDWLPALFGLVAAFLFGREFNKRKRAERTVKEMKKRDEIREDVRIDSDDALVDRLSEGRE